MLRFEPIGLDYFNSRFIHSVSQMKLWLKNGFVCTKNESLLLIIDFVNIENL